MATYDFRVKFMAWFNAIYFNSLPKNKIKKMLWQKRVLGRKDEGSKKFRNKSQHEVDGVAIWRKKKWKNHSTEFDCH